MIFSRACAVIVAAKSPNRLASLPFLLIPLRSGGIFYSQDRVIYLHDFSPFRNFVTRFHIGLPRVDLYNAIDTRGMRSLIGNFFGPS